MAEQLSGLGLQTTVDTFTATIPGRGRAVLRNLVAVVPGRSADAIVVLAHRDADAESPGADDNASGSAALLELARAYAAQVPSATAPEHTLIFLSSDGGAYGALGARRFARSSPYARAALAAINLDALSSGRRPRLEIAGSGPRSPSPLLVGTAAARLREQTGSAPGRAGALAQLVDLAFPFSLYEHAPLLGAGIPSLTLTRAGARPAEDGGGLAVDARRLGEMGRAAQALLSSLDAGIERAGGTGAAWYVAGRAVRGWALELLLVFLLCPVALTLLDLALRCRRRRLPLAPALRSLRYRLGFWLWAGALFFLFAVAGAWPRGVAAPVNPASEAAGHWPRLALAGYAALLVASWLVARRRLLRRRETSREEELAGQLAALLLLAASAVLAAALNPFSLLLVLPSLHAWLWLPQLRGRSWQLRAVVFALGLASPALLLASFAVRFGLGLDTPWYLAELAAIGYISPMRILVFLLWLAAAAQLLAVESGLYAPCPARGDRRRWPRRRLPPLAPRPGTSR
jgi:hypothetical protein